MSVVSPMLNLLVLRSPDIDRAIVFYRELGLSPVKHSHGSGPEHCAMEHGEFVFELYPLSSKQTSTESSRVGFRVDGIDELVVCLAEIGATVISSPRDSEWGRRAVLKDLDGHSVELIQSIRS